MGLFGHRPQEEERQWAGLPAEPREHGAADVLEAPSSADPSSLGPGFDDTASVSSIVFPVAANPAVAFAIENREPEDPEET